MSSTPSPIMEADTLWSILSDHRIPSDITWSDMERLQKIHDELLLALFRVLREWTDKHGSEAQYHEVVDDPHDGFHHGDGEELLMLCEHVMAHGEMCYDLMMRCPFSSQVFYWVYLNNYHEAVQDETCLRFYTRRDETCLRFYNSSYIYLTLPARRRDSPLWDTMVKEYVSSWLQNKHSNILKGL